ncbi:hypothetical protein BA059_22715 [Mycolicibacterium sp. (ex Dasyatis americana)]|nr:hypothetical protein BA059_22715 [Mycolicibacterium sp. (ex Dasyatis americana)]
MDGHHLDLDVLDAYLLGSDVPRVGALRARLVSGGRSNLTFLVSDDASAWILRRPPTAGATPSAHDMGREFRVMSALQSTTVPVARPVLLCEDVGVLGAPFTVVEYVDGFTVRTKDELASIASGSELDDDATTTRVAIRRFVRWDRCSQRASRRSARAHRDDRRKRGACHPPRSA